MTVENNLCKGISTTEFGTQLSGLGKLARFALMERDSVIKKIGAVALTSLALVASTIPGIVLTTAAFKATRFALAFSPHLIITIAGIAVATFILGYTIAFACAVPYYFSQEYLRQRQEQRIINAIGGKQFFDKLPVLKPEEMPVGDTGYLDKATPDLVKKQPITKGVDQHNRPFVCFYVKSQDNEYVTTLFQRYTDGCNTWVHTTHNHSPLFDIYTTFEGRLNAIRKLMANEHPACKLVT